MAAGASTQTTNPMRKKETRRTPHLKNKETAQLLEALKGKFGCETDQELANYLDVAPSSVSRWRKVGLPKSMKSLILLHLNWKNAQTMKLLQRLKQQLGCLSDAHLAQCLEMKESQVASWRHKDFPPDVVKILDKILPPLAEETLSYEERFQNKPCVYFVKSLETSRIKIGYTKNLKQRLSKMQTDSAETLKVVFAFESLPLDEKTLHAALSHDRHHGEWFEVTPELLEYIEEQKIEEQSLN